MIAIFTSLKNNVIDKELTISTQFGYIFFFPLFCNFLSICLNFWTSKSSCYKMISCYLLRYNFSNQKVVKQNVLLRLFIKAPVKKNKKPVNQY